MSKIFSLFVLLSLPLSAYAERSCQEVVEACHVLCNVKHPADDAKFEACVRKNCQPKDVCADDSAPLFSPTGN